MLYSTMNEMKLVRQPDMRILRSFILCLTTVVSMVSVSVLSTEVMCQRKFVRMASCSTDQPYSVVRKPSRTQCSSTCLGQPRCNDFNFDESTKSCSLYVHKPLFYEASPGCVGYKDKEYAKCADYGPIAPSTIPSQCCAIPFTFNGTVNYQCVDDGGVGCFHGDREWKHCQQPADFVARYDETSTRALSADPAVSVPLLTINGWILMQRKVTGGSVSFNRDWVEYRDGFGSAAGNDNYWLGLEKVYRAMQLTSVRLRVEVERDTGLWLWYSAEYSTFLLSDEETNYTLTVDGYSGDAGNALMTSPHTISLANGNMFTTKDSDNDLASDNCATRSPYLGGWWFGLCSRSFLNRDVGNGKWTSGLSVQDVQTSRILVKVN